MKSSFSNYIRNQVSAIQHFFEQEKGKKIAKWVKRLVNYGLILFTFQQVYRIGLADVLQNVPLNPLFYLIFLLIYFTLPFSEYFVYRRFSDIPFIDSQWTFHRKRFYNTSFVGYSGEVYLYNWLKNYTKSSAKEVFNFVKDNNILSIIASWLVVAMVGIYLLIADKSGLVNKIENDIKLYLAILFGILLLVILSILFFGKKLYKLDRKNSFIILIIHTFRSISVSLLQALQWFIIIPEAGFLLFLNFVALQMVISKIPFISGKDLIFTSLSIYLAKFTSMSMEVFTGLLVVNLLLNKILGVVSILYKKQASPKVSNVTE